MRTHLLSLAVTLSLVPCIAMGDDELRAALERRFKDDRTGACVAAAVIDKRERICLRQIPAAIR